MYTEILTKFFGSGKLCGCIELRMQLIAFEDHFGVPISASWCI